ncbi:uncharacterized protein RCC_00083 [Ramularia collo-cygni]|uniref:Uncharacterized protein n=1 Tax=Ramularia collo-cygni TaxID=112498 RepID=A0A2D3UMM9_9PEZI|nr:uncharacterized protein RCC_00083 [Ramularia collo-cygni]CZT14108.1 uncharacterized protein RCC_00083 [Ramularia collo-cygni]
MSDEAEDPRQESEVEIVTCAEELPHLDLQEYIYDGARQLYHDLPPGRSNHIVVVTNALGKHAELLLANELELQNIQVVGANIPFDAHDSPTTGSNSHRGDREAMDRLLIECKRLLEERSSQQTIPSPSLPELRAQILANARQCFPNIVQDYTTGRITETVMGRDSKYRPISRQVPLIIPESEIFDIAITQGLESSLQASLVYGRLEDLKFAMQGGGKKTYYGAMGALLEATVQRLVNLRESAPAKGTSSRNDSPMSGLCLPKQ